MASNDSGTGQRLNDLPPVGGGSDAVLGLYVLKVLDMIDGGTSRFANSRGEYPQRVLVPFEVIEVIDTEADDPDELIGQEWTKGCNKTMGKKAWLYSLATAVLGREIGRDERVTPSDLIDGVVKMNISEREGENGTETIWTPSAHKARAARRSSQAADDEREPVGTGRTTRRPNDPF